MEPASARADSRNKAPFPGRRRSLQNARTRTFPPSLRPVGRKSAIAVSGSWRIWSASSPAFISAASSSAAGFEEQPAHAPFRRGPSTPVRACDSGGGFGDGSTSGQRPRAERSVSELGPLLQPGARLRGRRPVVVLLGHGPHLLPERARLAPRPRRVQRQGELERRAVVREVVLVKAGFQLRL